MPRDYTTRPVTPRELAMAKALAAASKPHDQGYDIAYLHKNYKSTSDYWVYDWFIDMARAALAEADKPHHSHRRART
jgi:hypothetical protein